MSKGRKPSVSFDELLAQAEAPSTEPEPKVAQASRASPTAQPEPEASRPVSVQFFLADKDRDRLKRVGLDTRMSLNAICHEALSAWLEARGLPPLEWTAANFPSGRRPKG